MDQLQAFIRWMPLAFLIALVVVVFCKLVSGSISLRGLLTADRHESVDSFSVGRVQLLVFTVVVAVTYVRDMLVNPSSAELPDVQTQTLALLGGSQLFYLAGKARALWFRPTATSSSR